MTPRPSSKRRVAWLVVSKETGAPLARRGVFLTRREAATYAGCFKREDGSNADSVVRVEYDWPPAPKRATRKGAQAR